MRAVITTACWGKDYIDALARYSGASFLSPGNIPASARRHQITWQLIAPHADLETFLATDTCRQISEHCHIDAVAFEDHGIEIGKLPVGFDNNKYSFLSNLQNLAMRRAEGHDVLLFNYADCLWQDGSLLNAIEMIGDDGTDVVLTLGIPVDETRGKAALETFRENTSPQAPLILPPRQTPKLIFENLHAETKLRYWENPHFSNTPSYLIWDVPGEGAIVRCVHQTIVALRVQPEDPTYRAGIIEGSLDGNFSAIAISKWRYQVAADTDKLTLFSLYDSAGSSEKRPELTHEAALKLLMLTIPIQQRALLLEPLLFKFRFDDTKLWQQRVAESEEDLRQALENTNSKVVGSQLLGTIIGYLLYLKNGPRGGSASGEAESHGRMRKVAKWLWVSGQRIASATGVTKNYVANQLPRLQISKGQIDRLVSRAARLRLGPLKPVFKWLFVSTGSLFASTRRLIPHFRGTAHLPKIPPVDTLTRYARVPISPRSKKRFLVDNIWQGWSGIVKTLGRWFGLGVYHKSKSPDTSKRPKSV